MLCSYLNKNPKPFSTHAQSRKLTLVTTLTSSVSSLLFFDPVSIVALTVVSAVTLTAVSWVSCVERSSTALFK